MAVDVSIVICTLGKPTLAQVLDRLDRQTAPPESFEVVVVADAAAKRLDVIQESLAGRRYRTRLLQAPRPGASAARNLGLEESDGPLVLFIGDDNLPEQHLLAEHLSWHERHPAPEVGVLGRVRWADSLRVTPFMRWLEHGIQFDYPNIEGSDAGWARFYTANVSAKRRMIELVGGFNEDDLPFLYEDLDLALRMRGHGFRLLYNSAAVAEHLHPTDVEAWQGRAGSIASAEQRFVELHPDFEPYFYEMFSQAATAPRVGALGARLAWVVPRGFPLLGPIVWSRADAFYRQSLAAPFLAAWNAQRSGAVS